MDSFQQIRVTGQRLQRARIIGTQLFYHFLLEGFQICKGHPGQLTLEILPDPLGWIEFGAGWWLEYECNIGRQAQAFGEVCPGIVEQHYVETVRMRLCKFVDE